MRTPRVPTASAPVVMGPSVPKTLLRSPPRRPARSSVLSRPVPSRFARITDWGWPESAEREVEADWMSDVIVATSDSSVASSVLVDRPAGAAR